MSGPTQPLALADGKGSSEIENNDIDGFEFDSTVAEELLGMMMQKSAVDGSSYTDEIDFDHLMRMMQDSERMLQNSTDDDDMFDFSSLPPVEWDLLLSAAMKNQPEKIREMIEVEGVPVTHGNHVGQTALHIAVMWGHVDCALVLIELGANVNAANRISGDTPLHTTVQSIKINAEVREVLINLLLDKGANPNLEDYYKKVPAKYLNSKLHPNRSALEQIIRARARPRNAREILLNSLTSDIPGCMPCRPMICSRAKKKSSES